MSDSLKEYRALAEGTEFKEKENYSSFDMTSKLHFTSPTKVSFSDLTKNNSTFTTYTRYTKEKIRGFLKAPESNSQALRDASIYLYEVSTQYRRLINHFAKMSTLSYIVVPIKIDTTKTNTKAFAAGYKKALDFLEIMNLRHELQKVLVTAFKEDVFYGYNYQTKDSFYIRKLDPNYCKISSIEDGCFMYAFDFSYFRSNEDQLVNYGSEFESKYNAYKSDTKLQWQELDSKNQFCVKFCEEINFPMIPFAGCLEGIYDIEDYKALQKAKTEVENYKILSLQIPIDEEGNLKLDLDLCKDFYRQLGNVLPSNIGAFMTPMEVKDYAFDRAGATDSDRVSQAQTDFFRNAGISALLFGGETSSSASLNISIRADEQMVFGFMRQIERCVNRLLKGISGTVKFKVNFLDTTYYHLEETNKTYMTAAQFGLPTKSAVAACSGLSGADFSNMVYLENDVLQLHNKLIPLVSSHTQTTTDVTASEGGAPTKAEQGEDLSDAGEKTAESGSNENQGIG